MDATTDPESVFAAVRERVLTDFPQDGEGKMLNAIGLKTGGKFYAFASRSGVMLKLPAADVRDIIASGAGVPCETKPGRPMKEWVTLPAPDHDECLAYVLEARTFVASLTAR